MRLEPRRHVRIGCLGAQVECADEDADLRGFREAAVHLLHFAHQLTEQLALLHRLELVGL